jgi:hypothetical protein
VQHQRSPVAFGDTDPDTAAHGCGRHADSGTHVDA